MDTNMYTDFAGEHRDDVLAPVLHRLLHIFHITDEKS